MTRTLLLIASTDQIEDGNYLKIVNQLLEVGQHDVAVAFMESLAMRAGNIIADGYLVDKPMHAGSNFDTTGPLDLHGFDRVWVLSLGIRTSFLDKMQLLYALPTDVQVINSVNSLMNLKSKYFIARHTEYFKHPETWASNNPDQLMAVIEQHGGKWIIKPPALSMGREVFLVTPGDRNTRVILESLTGPNHDQYCLLQRYVDEIESGEKRVLLAGGKPVGQYLRLPGKDHRTNIVQGANYAPCDLTQDEHDYCTQIGRFLLQQGAEFVGMDLAYPWVIEFNVVNPGGVVTIEELTGQNIMPEIVANIVL